MFEKYDELFDDENGGALYVNDLGGEYHVAGTLWLDGGCGGNHYFAFIACFRNGDEKDDDIVVRDFSTAAEAFARSVDGDVIDGQPGWFPDIESAKQAVWAYVAHEYELAIPIEHLSDLLARADALGYGIVVDADQFADFNCRAGGYYELEDDEHIASFRAFVENEWDDVFEVVDVPEEEWFVLRSEGGYDLAVPYGATIKYRLVR